MCSSSVLNVIPTSLSLSPVGMGVVEITEDHPVDVHLCYGDTDGAPAPVALLLPFPRKASSRSMIDVAHRPRDHHWPLRPRPASRPFCVVLGLYCIGWRMPVSR